LSAFQIVNGIVFSFSTLFLLKELRFKRYLYFVLIILFALWMNQTGLRPDALGMALLFLGLLFLTKDHSVYWFLGSFLVIASFLSSTLVLAAYGISFSFAILLIQYSRVAPGNSKSNFLRIRLLCVILAILANSFIFLLLINFNVNAWLTDFLLHASMRRTPTSQAFPAFFRLLTESWNSVVLMPSYIVFIIFSIGYLITLRKTKNPNLILLVALIVAILLNIIIYSSSINFANFFIFLGVLCMASQLSISSRLNKFVFLFCLGVVLSSQSLKVLYLVSRNHLPQRYYKDVEMKVAQSKRPDKYVVDAVAAKYVYDYKLPPNATSWEFIELNRYPSIANKKKNELWIVSKSNIAQYVPELGVNSPKVKFLNRNFNSLSQNPFEILILP
jgi:hypothetical protein